MKKIRTKTFVRSKFSEYYQQKAPIIRPPSIEKREFAVFLLKERVMIRHKPFKNAEALREFLKRTVPSDVYCSAAYYEKPEEEMRKKGWLGADLIFDIDSDHIPTPCAKSHDTWICISCKTFGRGISPNACPKCGEQRFDEKTWPCEVCLESSKKEMIKLMGVLMKDFGFSSKELNVFFSGHRGYHLHVRNEEIQTLDSMARKEITDYVVGTGIETKFHGLEKGKQGIINGPNLDDLGWRGRIARGTYDVLHAATPDELESTKLKKRAINAIVGHREKITESWKMMGPWGIMRGISVKDWRNIAQQGVKKQSAKIDTVVTTDIHRLIRLTNTLHGKTGLKKVRTPQTNIEGFDPLKSAIAFEEGTARVMVSEAPQFRLGDEIYGPYKREKVELSTAAALLLSCKGRAKISE